MGDGRASAMLYLLLLILSSFFVRKRGDMKHVRSMVLVAALVGLTIQGSAATGSTSLEQLERPSLPNATLEQLCVALIQTDCEIAEPEWWYDGDLTCAAADPPCGAYISGGDWSTIGCAGDALKWKGSADCEDPN
jgi:hypothetical protein